MLVIKFGGTSLANASRINQVYKIINTNEPKIIVVSAIAGITNILVEIVFSLSLNANFAVGCGPPVGTGVLDGLAKILPKSGSKSCNFTTFPQIKIC